MVHSNNSKMPPFLAAISLSLKSRTCTHAYIHDKGSFCSAFHSVRVHCFAPVNQTSIVIICISYSPLYWKSCRYLQYVLLSGLPLGFRYVGAAWSRKRQATRQGKANVGPFQATDSDNQAQEGKKEVVQLV